MDLDKAIRFVKQYGNSIEQARLSLILTQERPSPDVVTELFRDQRDDGGWAPFWAGDYSSLDATCYRLAQAEQLGLTSSTPAVVQAINFLTRRQLPNGSWEEDMIVAHLTPPWATPGDLSAVLYLTANCGFWIALWGGSDSRVAKAADFLNAYLDEEGMMPSFLHTHWLAGALWHKLRWSEPAKRTSGFLLRHINTFSASNLAWFITTMSAVEALEGNDLVNKAILRLEHMQQDDGRWLSEDGENKDVHTTLEAIRSLWLYRQQNKL